MTPEQKLKNLTVEYLLDYQAKYPYLFDEDDQVNPDLDTCIDSDYDGMYIGYNFDEHGECKRTYPDDYEFILYIVKRLSD